MKHFKETYKTFEEILYKFRADKMWQILIKTYTSFS